MKGGIVLDSRRFYLGMTGEGGSSTVYSNLKKDDNQERLRLLYEIGKQTKLTHAQVLYASVEKLREMKRRLFKRNTKNAEVFESEFKDDFKLHEELKELCIYSYHADRMSLPEGYTLEGYMENKKSGFNAYVAKKENDVVIVFRGTDTLRDWREDAKMANPFKADTGQFNDGQRILDMIKQTPEYKDCRIILTGHSLGGSIGEIIGGLNDVDTVTFNPHGIGNIIQKMANERDESIEIFPERVINYRRPWDILSSIQSSNNIGTTYKVQGRVMEEGEWDILHDIENMDDLRTRRLDDVKTNNDAYVPNSKRKYVVEPKKRIIRLRKPKPCVGSYDVSSYTRSDGTQVRGYVRKCGAKHLGR